MQTMPRASVWTQVFLLPKDFVKFQWSDLQHGRQIHIGYKKFTTFTNNFLYLKRYKIDNFCRKWIEIYMSSIEWWHSGPVLQQKVTGAQCLAWLTSQPSSGNRWSWTRMWANAQRDGRPVEYRWRRLFNAAKFGWRPLL